MDKSAGKHPPVPPAAPGSGNSLDQMAEEIFSLTVMGWRERLSSKQPGSVDLSESQYLAIDALYDAPGSMTVGEIQRAIGVLPAQMSRIMRSLETAFDKPLVRCELNQSDKRKIDVVVTAEGRRTYEEFRGVRLCRTVNILRQLEEADRQDFVRVCRQIRELYSQTENIPKSEHSKP